MSDADTWDKRYKTADLIWSEGPNQLVADLVTPLSPGRAVDLGTGEGRNAIWLASRGWQVTAVDFSAVGIEKARTLAGARGVEVTWVVADLTNEHIPRERAFDLALIAYLHLPTEQLRHVLTGAAKSLTPGGHLLVIGHDRSNLEKGIGGPQDPAVLYTTDLIESTLDEVEMDFALDRSEIVERIVQPASGTSNPRIGNDVANAEGNVALDTLVWGRRL